MPKGGARSRSGPLPRTEEQQRAVGGRVRPWHRQQRSVGTAATASGVKPPPGLSAAQLRHWRYFAPLLERAGRLTLECREELASYCIACAEVDRINKEMQKPEYKPLMLSVTVDGAGNQHVNGKTNPLNIALKNWLETKRKIAADLLVTPATAIRAPGPMPTAKDREHEPEEEAQAKPRHDFYGEDEGKQKRPM